MNEAVAPILGGQLDQFQQAFNAQASMIKYPVDDRATGVAGPATSQRRSERSVDDEDEDLYSGSSSSNAHPARQNFGPSQTEQMYGIRKSAEHAPRRSVEQQRYDSDPHVLDDSEFSRLELRDDEAR